MAITLNGPAPYAPSSAILETITRHRKGTLSGPVTAQTLERIGIGESLRPRTLQSLKLLDLIDAEGNITAEFEDLRKVTTPEFLPALAQMLRAVYADVFAIVDPSGASFQMIHDAFRGFTPPGQIDRMVWLFLQLLDFTGEWTDLPSARSGPKTAMKAAKKVAPKKAKSPEPAETPIREPEIRRPPSEHVQVYSQSVRLTSGAGSVTLTVDVNPLALKGADRAFFYELVDKMDDYGTPDVPTQPAAGSTNAWEGSS